MRCIAELCGVAFEESGLECQEAPLRRWVLLLLFFTLWFKLRQKIPSFPEPEGSGPKAL